tara:strand:+ start:220 stop:582 length:363 start_codon:yes stop_codon:yes gene_type:complete
MTRKRARTSTGQLKADDPSTPDVNEAWVEVEEAPSPVAPSMVAKKKKAPKNDTPDECVYFVSSNVENGAFDLMISDDISINGRWDAERAYVHWRVPREHKEMAMMHHHIWSGRVICCEDD